MGIIITDQNNRQVFGLRLPEQANKRASVALSFALKVGKHAEVRHPLPDLAADKQGAVGPLCAGAVECLLREQTEGVIIFGQATRQLLESPYFWISAKTDPGGTLTTIGRLEADSPEAAEKMFKSLPEVMLNELVGTFESKTSAAV